MGYDEHNTLNTLLSMDLWVLAETYFSGIFCFKQC